MQTTGVGDSATWSERVIDVLSRSTAAAITTTELGKQLGKAWGAVRFAVLTPAFSSAVGKVSGVIAILAPLHGPISLRCRIVTKRRAIRDRLVGAAPNYLRCADHLRRNCNAGCAVRAGRRPETSSRRYEGRRVLSSDSLFAASVTMSIRRCILLCRSGMFTLSVTR